MSESTAHHRATGLSHHPWNAEEDAFLAFMVASGLTVDGIRLTLKEIFNVDLRENQITGRIADIKKSTRSPCFFMIFTLLNEPQFVHQDPFLSLVAQELKGISP